MGKREISKSEGDLIEANGPSQRKSKGVFNWLSNFFTRKQRDEPDASKTPDSLDGDADEQASKSVRDSKQQLVRRKNSSENMVNFATYTHADCDNVCGSIVRSDFSTWPWIITIHALPWSVVCPKLSSLIGPTTTTACIFIE